MKKIDILDSTLRDGSQGEGISYSVQDKINIVKALEEYETLTKEDLDNIVKYGTVTAPEQIEEKD